jgi:hypothetical protein
VDNHPQEFADSVVGTYDFCLMEKNGLDVILGGQFYGLKNPLKNESGPDQWIHTNQTAAEVEELFTRLAAIEEQAA